MFINIDVNLFNNHKIKYLKNMENGERYILIWIQLLTIYKTNNKNGFLYNKKLKQIYTTELLAVDIPYSIDTINKALALFESLSMIEQTLEGIKIKNWDKYQSSKEKTTNNDINNFEYKEVVSLYNEYCTNLPKVRLLNTHRNKLIKNATKIFKSLQEFKDYFIQVNSIPYLIGDNKYGWQANFDWCLKENNIAKILEGRYSTNFANQTKNYDTKSLLKNVYNNVDDFL